ncbi:MAG: hypothetical protein NT082_02120 [Chloroflexi bacterium]|nr:hypothetical protein [Chloroflexota bacterium]
MKNKYSLILIALILLVPALIPSCMWPFQSSSLPTISSFTASPASVTAGGSVVLSWNVSSATTIIIDQGVGIVDTTGSAAVTPATTTTYTLTAVNASGANSKTAVVTVTGTSATTTIPPPGPPLIQYFTVTPTGITPKGTAVLSWSVVGASSVTIDNGIGNVAPANTRAVSPNFTTTYMLTALNPAGTSLGYAVLTVASASPPSTTGPSNNKDWLGSTYTYEYHYPGCSIAQNIPFPSRIWFDTVAQAKAAGYHACPVCKPPK